MKTILVPTDFSANAEHALRYALEMNKTYQARLILHHSFVVPVYATDLPVVMLSDSDLEKTSTEALANIRTKVLADFPDASIDISVSSGYAEDEIPNAAEKWKADLIVMGTQGASGLREALIGTISAAVMERSDCPVLAVPADARWTGIRRIVYATSYEEGDFGYVGQVIAFARKFNAEVTLLHISNGEIDKAYEYNAIERFKESLANDSHFHKLSFKLIEDKDVYHALNVYLDEVKADIVAMTMRHRSFVQKVFGKSITKKMAYHTHIPLIAFRTGD